MAMVHAQDKSIDLPMIKHSSTPQQTDMASPERSLRLNALNVIEEARVSRNHTLLEESKTDTRVGRRHLNV